ncbi:hypothetical protein BJX76DRAFT_345929 [Aspergillus varians]
MTPDFVLDPDGEVTILLRNRNAPFAVWGVSREIVPAGAAHSSRSSEEGGNVAESTTAAEVLVEVSVPDEPTGQADAGSEPAPVRFKVSARHLILGSPVFRRMLKDGWKETQLLQEQGTLEIPAYDFDSEAFLAFLHIIHCQPTSLPQRIRFEQVARLAVIADYYECRSLVGYYVTPVIDRLTNQPKQYSRNLILWIWVSYFFQRSEVFHKCTKVAMEEAPTRISSLNLPIPGEIINALNAGRIRAINAILGSLHRARRHLTNTPSRCTEECHALVLGSLIMQMNSSKLLAPRPQPPFIGLSQQKLKTTVYGFRCPPSKGIRHTKHYKISNSVYTVNSGQRALWKDATAPSFVEHYGDIKWDVKGLSLADYMTRINLLL